MPNILHGLFTGGIIPWERPYEKNAEKLELSRQIDEQERYFKETLSQRDNKRLEELLLLYTSRDSIEETSVFPYGFSLGLLLMLDVLEQEKHMVTKR